MLRCVISYDLTVEELAKHLQEIIVFECMKKRFLVCLIVAVVTCPLWSQQLLLSFSEAEAHMLASNEMLKVAEAGVSIAKYEQGKTRAWWWPQLQAHGVYAHLSEQVEVRQPLSRFTAPAKAYVQNILPSETFITGLLDKVGEYTLTFPLLPQDITSIGLTAEWVAFSGGKRLYADRIARRLVDVAEVNRQKVTAAEQILLVERYYGLVLSRQTEAVCRERYEGLQRHYKDALRLEEVGMIDKATRLFAQVNMEEAAREWQHAKNVERTAQNALKQMLGMDGDTLQIVPSSPLLIDSHLPSELTFMAAMCSANPTLNILYLEERMTRDKFRIDQSAYLPDIALFGKQTLYAHGLPSNLSPRTVVGVGFTWNLFDGLERERQLAQTRLAQQSLAWSREETEDELGVAVSDLYATLLQSRDEAEVLGSNIALGEELLRMRRIAFAEGMATSAEVIDAENTLSETKLARLAAYYAYDVALVNLLALCGITNEFGDYIQ